MTHTTPSRERHECACGKTGVRWIVVTLPNLTCDVLWFCEDCWEDECKPEPPPTQALSEPSA